MPSASSTRSSRYDHGGSLPVETMIEVSSVMWRTDDTRLQRNRTIVSGLTIIYLKKVGL